MVTDEDLDDLALGAAVGRLVRGGWDELESSVYTHAGSPTPIGECRARLHCHFLRSDASGKPRLESLAQQLADQVIHYCIPRSDLAAAQALPPDRQGPAIARLAREATRLFTTTQKVTGEGAELLLYTLLEKNLQIPQVLSKMSLKTSTEMQVHGADGVHAKVLDNGDLALYWGEAKMYESLQEAMTSALDSLRPMLLDNAADQDLFLVRHFIDTGSIELTARLLEYFDDGSLKSANVHAKGACLIGFTYDSYPRLPRELKDVAESLDAALSSWIKSIETRLTNREMREVEVEIFFFPVPSSSQFRTAVKAALGIPT